MTLQKGLFNIYIFKGATAAVSKLHALKNCNVFATCFSMLFFMKLSAGLGAVFQVRHPTAPKRSEKILEANRSVAEEDVMSSGKNLFNFSVYCRA